MKKNPEQPKKYRSIWISDVHLGTPGCQAEQLAHFLKHNSCENLYLVGDIIDGWRLKSKFYWPQEHNNVVRRVLTMAKRDTNVFYVTGNHDEFLRKFVDYQLEIGNIRIVNDCIHTTADGRELLVVHGDLFDVVTRYHAWIALIGGHAYDALLHASTALSRIRSRFGMPYWSLSSYTKHKVKGAVNFISDFEKSVAYECRKRDLDGVVCGHIHHAEIRDIENVSYYNCGDWVESCSALTEAHDGEMQLVYWHNRADQYSADSAKNIVPLVPRNTDKAA